MAIAKIHYMVDLSRTELTNLIDEYLFSVRDREVAKARWLDGLTFEEIATKFDISERGAKDIIRRCRERVLNHVDALKLHQS